MRKAIVLVLLIVLGTMPLQASAQISVPAVDLYCVNLDGNLQTDNIQQEDGANNSTSPETSSFVDEGPLAWIDAWGPVLNDTVNCTISNPNSYVERIQIQVSADGLVVSASNSSITLAPNGEEAFNVTVRADDGMTPSTRTLTITATVVEANGAPPPNIAESQVSGDIYLSKFYRQYGDNGCATFAENGIPQRTWSTKDNQGIADNDLVTMNIEHLISNDNESTVVEGNVTLRLNRSAAPLHSQNFYTLTLMGCFDELPFHRVIDGFVIQSGDFEGTGMGGNAAFWAGYCGGQTADENGTNYTAHTCPTTDWSLPGEHMNELSHGPGSLGAAHAGLNTDGSQFYIIPSDSFPCHLDADKVWDFNTESCIEVEDEDCSDWSSSCHTVFGKVVAGLDFVDYISEVETDTSTDAPVHDVIIKEAYLEGKTDTDGDGTPDDIDEFPDDENETTDSDGDGVGDNSDAFPNDGNETHDDDSDGVGNNSDAFPDDPDETHDDDGDGVGNNTDEFPQDPDEQFDKDGDGVGDNADDFPDNKYASNWSTIYAAVGTLIVLLIGAGVMISRMKKEDELPNVPASNELEQLEKQIEELEKKKSQMLEEQDPTELMFED